MRATRRSALWAVLSAALLFPSAARAIEPSNLLVLYNSAVADSVDIKNYYQSVYPGVHTLDLYNPALPTTETITADQYLTLVRPTVMSGIAAIESTGGRIDVMATTKGLPLRIQVTQPQPPSVFPNLPKYTDPWGVEHSILNWRAYSSLESELAGINRVASWEMMGDQSYNLNAHFTQNPYYGSTSNFSSDQYDTYLTSRLDGFTKQDVFAAIDRAQNAYIGPNNVPTGPYHFIVDNDLSQDYTWTMTKLVDEVLVPRGMPLTGNNDPGYVGTAPGPVIGYDGHGDHQASTPDNYIEYMTSTLGTTLADGAVFTSIESYNAYTFNEGGYTPNPMQGQLGQWLKFGGTAGVGYVEEPTASWKNLSNENLLFQSLLDGKTFAEAAWSANYQISYVNTVIGDPLMVWRQLLLGDINTDGVVDIGDLAIMGHHWGESVAAGGAGWTIGDINCDGVIDISDLALVGPTWGQSSLWAQSAANTRGYQAYQLGIAIQDFIVHPNPEPSSLALLAAGLAVFPAYRRLSRRRAARQRAR